jgi:hypothetical protein
VVARIYMVFLVHGKRFINLTLITDVLPPCGSYPLVLT